MPKRQERRVTDKMRLDWLLDGTLEIRGRWILTRPMRGDIDDLIRQEKSERAGRRIK